MRRFAPHTTMEDSESKKLKTLGEAMLNRVDALQGDVNRLRDVVAALEIEIANKDNRIKDLERDKGFYGRNR